MSVDQFNKTTFFTPEYRSPQGATSISIFDGNKPPFRVDLAKFGKNYVTFGRDASNDISFGSPLVSRVHHGHFLLQNGMVIVEDGDSRNGLILNGMATKRAVLSDGDMLRIDDGIQSIKEGVLILLNSEEGQSPWKSFTNMGQADIRIGRSPENDIELSHVGVSQNHAVIRCDGNRYYIHDNNSTNGVFVNGQRTSGWWPLEEKDIIIITNTKLIFTFTGIYYSSNKNGLRIDACNIVRTVQNKGKVFNICNDVSLSIKPGELVAIIGGSGAGKTTLMNAISGYNQPTSGRVLINGDDLYESYDALKNIIGYVPQQDIVYDNLTLFSMLNYAAKLRLPDDTTKQEREARVDTVIEMVELTGKESTMIRQLSGGQKKRASIAVELLSDPNLFFLDEPASGLDPGTERNLMHTLKRMTDDGKTIVLVTHSTLNLQECDKIIFMGKGGNLCYFGNMKDAEKFFHVDTLVDVYNMITENPYGWRQQYDTSAEVSIPNIQQGAPMPAQSSANRHGALRQLGVLATRYLRLLVNDRQRLLMVLLQAPLLALLISLVKDDDAFKIYNSTKPLLFALSCSAFWIGMLNAIQEVCKERNILRREYMTGLHLSSYVLSKFAILGLLCFVQSLMLTGVFSVAVGLPEEGVFLPPFIEFFITTFLTAYAATGMGLFTSSLFKNQDRAMTVAPLLLMPQILFSGLLFELSGATKYISWFAICRWSMEGYGTAANLNDLERVMKSGDVEQPFPKVVEDFFTFTTEHIMKDWLILLAFVLGFGILSVIVLRSVKKND